MSHINHTIYAFFRSIREERKKEEFASTWPLGFAAGKTKKAPNGQNWKLMHVSFSNGTSGRLLGQYWGSFSGQKILLNCHPCCLRRRSRRRIRPWRWKSIWAGNMTLYKANHQDWHYILMALIAELHRPHAMPRFTGPTKGPTRSREDPQGNRTQICSSQAESGRQRKDEIKVNKMLSHAWRYIYHLLYHRMFCG